MRLGQLARKYDISIEVLISSIKKNGLDVSELKPNSKLDEEIEEILAEQYEPVLSVAIEVAEEITDETEENILEDDGDIEITEPEPKEEQDILLPESEFEELPRREDQDILMPESKLKELPRIEHRETIETDRLLELLESEDTDVDLSNITLIKASKKELTGLKVLGKIELEEPVTKPTEKAEEEESSIKSEAISKPEHEQLVAEEQEEKRLMFKKRRKDYEARQEKQERQKLEQQKKAIKKAHYEGKIKETKSIQPKKKGKITKLQEPQTEVEAMDQLPKPKTAFGKLWRWLNSE